MVVITILYRIFRQSLFFNLKLIHCSKTLFLTYPFLLPNHVNNSSILPPKVGVFCSKRNIISSLRLWTAADFGQFFNISVLSLYKEFLDEMFLIVKFSYQSLWHDYFIVKFFVQTIRRCWKIVQSCPAVQSHFGWRYTFFGDIWDQKTCISLPWQQWV